MLKTKAISKIPKHLHKYVVEQDYDRYTSEDQEVWRFVMRQLKSFLGTNAHGAYLKGLSLTGITTDQIPEITKMDEKLIPFGWRAMPVSGFIPPAAFMEFQAFGILPIACDMRTVDHILYTPAPDIVHEAAGHAPILIDPEFSQYLKNYAEVASKAIISHEDLNLYEAIRNLSDIKEAPQSSKEDILKSEQELKIAIQNTTYISEAQFLGRMNWWTAEYGLIGSLKNPKIFGAGLLSSIGESRLAVQKPKLIPLTIDCLNYSYDITEPQPQLFVSEDFKSLNLVLNELGQTMAFKVGGLEGLRKAKEAKTVCTVVLVNDLINESKSTNESNIQTESQSSYSGILIDYNSIGLTFKGPIQIKENNEIRLLHDDVFKLKINNKTVTSVYGGPIDSSQFPDSVDFVATRVPTKNRSDYDLKKFELYSQIRLLRSNFSTQDFLKIKSEYIQNYKSEWLMGLGLLELCAPHVNLEPQLLELVNHYSQYQVKSENEKLCVDLGLALLKSEGLLL